MCRLVCFFDVRQTPEDRFSRVEAQLIPRDGWFTLDGPRRETPIHKQKNLLVFELVVLSEINIFSNENYTCSTFLIYGSHMLFNALTLNIRRVPRKLFEHEANKQSVKFSPEGPGKL